MLSKTDPDSGAASGAPSPIEAPAWLAIESGCGRLIAGRDWTATSLGPIEGWPQSLRTALGMVLASPVPIVMLWGEEGIMLYNDAYSVFAGGRHPQLLGSRVREGWPEVADFNDNVMKVGLAGGTLSYKDQELTLHRHGAPEQVFMNLDYSPVPGDDGQPAGVLAIVIETTQRLIAEQQRAQARAELQAAADLAGKEAAERAAILRQLAEGVIVTDAEGRITFVNEAARLLHGVDALDVEPTEYSDTYHLFREDGSPYPFEELPLARAVMKGEAVVDARWRIRRPDGTEVLAIGNAQPIMDASERQIGSVLTVRDDTMRFASEVALAEALKTSEVLLHEVNHRVKNSLQIVTGLLMLQASQAKDMGLRQALLEARGRISVVAAMHQRLYTTSQHDRVDFGEYVSDLTAETLVTLGGDERIALEARIEPGIMVVLQHAVPLALVVSELVTNAVKYAFPGDRTGKIRLLLQRVDDQIVLEVADDGVGLPSGFDPNARSGLGMRIVTSLVKQVRGRLEIGTEEPGASFRISIPLDRMN